MCILEYNGSIGVQNKRFPGRVVVSNNRTLDYVGIFHTISHVVFIMHVEKETLLGECHYSLQEDLSTMYNCPHVFLSAFIGI